MRVNRKKKYAVLTGDVVGSSKLDDAKRRALQREVKRIGREIRQAFAVACPLDLDMFRGDGWQLLAVEPIVAVRVALFFRVSLRFRMRNNSIDSRVSIGIGKIRFIPKDRVSEGDGSAFRLSGHGLDATDRRIRMLMTVEDVSCPLLTATLSLVDALVQGWTANQAQAVLGALKGWTQERIAKEWEPKAITQQAVGQHLDRSQWHLVDTVVKTVERELKGQLQQADELVDAENKQNTL